MSEPTMATVLFLKVPAEIRLMVYKLLRLEHEDMTLRIRTEDPSVYERRKQHTRRRTKFRYIKRSRSAESTYCLDRSSGYIWSTILGVNRQIHTEVSHVLYPEHTFGFGTDIESISARLEDFWKGFGMYKVYEPAHLVEAACNSIAADAALSKN